jgi:hypothetical protein
MAVSKDYVVAVVRSAARNQVIEFLDPMTFDRLASVDLPPRTEPEWIAASADGATVVTPELSSDDRSGVRIWYVE